MFFSLVLFSLFVSILLTLAYKCLLFLYLYIQPLIDDLERKNRCTAMFPSIRARNE